MLAAVEAARTRAIELREADDVALDGLLTLVRDLDAELAPSVVRAFASYFHIINTLEQEHRLRSPRARSLASPDEPLRESIGEAVDRIPADLAPDDLQAFLANLCVTPTFTAHLTESRRRAILDLLARLGELVRLSGDRPLTREERDTREARILEAITLLWQTEEVRPRRPTVLDEVQSVLGIVGRASRSRRTARRAGADVAQALRRPTSGRAAPRRPLLGRRRPRRQPERHARGHPPGDHAPPGAGIDRATFAALSSSPRTSRSPQPGAGDTRAALCPTAADELPETAVELERRAPIEPYRQKLGYIGERLRRRSRRPGTPAAPPGTYANADELIADLDLGTREPASRAGGPPRRRRARRPPRQRLDVRVPLRGAEIRQHSERHEQALAEILAAAGHVPDYPSLDEEERTALLARLLEEGRLAGPASPA